MAFIQLLPNDKNSQNEIVQIKPPPEPKQISEPINEPLVRGQKREKKDKPQEIEGENTAGDKLNTEPADPATVADELALDQVVAHWPELRAFLDDKDSNIPRLLASAKPLATDGNTLIIGFEFPLLKDKFDGKPTAAARMIEGLNHLLGINCLVRTVVTNQFDSSSLGIQIDDDEFAAFAEEIGGTVSDGDDI
jgi:hypothetical protein